MIVLDPDFEVAAAIRQFLSGGGAGPLSSLWQLARIQADSNKKDLKSDVGFMILCFEFTGFFPVLLMMAGILCSEPVAHPGIQLVGPVASTMAVTTVISHPLAFRLKRRIVTDGVIQGFT